MPRRKADASELTEVKEKKPTGRRPMSIAENITDKGEELRETIRVAIKNATYFRGRGVVKNDAECEERITEYFDYIIDSGNIPTVEGLCLALGTTRMTVHEWENGSMGSNRANMIKRAKEVLSALDAELASKGKIPPIVWIFKSKNHYNYKDTTELTVTAANALGDDVDRAELAKQYAENMPDIVDVDFTEE